MKTPRTHILVAAAILCALALPAAAGLFSPKGDTVGVNLSPIQLQLSYAHSVAKNSYGFDGQGVRFMLIWPF